MEEGKRSAQGVWGATPAGTTLAAGAQVGTKEFFETVLARRSREEQPWLFELVPFASFATKRVLELGCGAGYDAYEIVRHGARYVGIDITPENPARVREHLAHYGLEPRTLVADAERLPFSSGSFEVAFSNGVLHHTPSIERAFAEAHRVLRAGGDFWVIVYHRNSVFYRLRLWFAEHVVLGGWRKMSLAERVSRIEATTSDALPIVNVYSRRQLAKLLRRASFEVLEVEVRKLTPEDLPRFWWDEPASLRVKLKNILGSNVNRLLDRIPRRWLDRLGRRWGWYVIAHAKKPA